MKRLKAWMPRETRQCISLGILTVWLVVTTVGVSLSVGFGG